MKREWALFGALAVVVLAGWAVVALAAGGDGHDQERAPAMRVERATSPTGLAELLVTVSGQAGVADGGKGVGLRCRGGDGTTVVSARYPWPLPRDGQEEAPHIHQPATRGEMDRIETCALAGTRPPLEARLAPR